MHPSDSAFVIVISFVRLLHLTATWYHIWVWWVQNDSRLTAQHRQWLQDYEQDGLGVSILSCWEIAKLVEKNRLILPLSINEWLATALAYPGVQLLDLTLPIVVDSTQLNGFHSDPFD
jgi:PIN domain nuclease of toxin-antitoxin system